MASAPHSTSSLHPWGPEFTRVKPPHLLKKAFFPSLPCSSCLPSPWDVPLLAAPRIPSAFIHQFYIGLLLLLVYLSVHYTASSLSIGIVFILFFYFRAWYTVGTLQMCRVN